MSMNVYAKFRCAPLRIKEALGIFRKLITTAATTVAFWDPPCSENHCLGHIYTVNEEPGAMRLRTRGHNFMLPFVKYNFNKKNFIVRALYNYF